MFAPLEQKSESSIFVDIDGQKFLGAKGVFKMLACGNRRRWDDYYSRSRVFAWVSERIYKLVSKCRTCAWEFTKMIFPSAKHRG